MKITPKKINAFMFFKLPLAWLSGMRVKKLNETTCEVFIKHKWINQNPFKSMFWAAQGMAAEMSTGVLVMQAIAATDKKVSMLVTHQEGSFFKKATGNIEFTCNAGDTINNAIALSAKTNEGQKISLLSNGVNSDGVIVATFKFEWSLKVKNC